MKHSKYIKNRRERIIKNIENYLSCTEYKTRKQLAQETGLSDRAVRNLISDLKTRRVVIYSSQRSGYRLAKEIKSMSKVEREKEVSLVKHTLNDCKSRTKVLNKQKPKYIAYIKEAEQIELGAIKRL